MAQEPSIRQRVLQAAARRKLLLGAAAAAIALVVLVLLVMAVSHLFERAAQRQQERRALAAAEIARQVGAAVAGARTQLQALAAEPAVRAAVAGADPAAREAAIARAQKIPQLLKLRLLPLDGYDVDDDPRAPLTYASLEMLQRARRGAGPVPAEIHLPGSARQHLVILAPIAGGDGAPIGFVHGALDPALVTGVLAHGDPDGVYVELRQPAAKGDPAIVGRAGGQAPPAADSVAEVGVPGTAWKVAIWGEPGGELQTLDAASEDASPYGGLMLIAILLLVLVVAFLLYKRRSAAAAAPAADQVTYQGAVRAIMEGAHPGLERLVPGLVVAGNGGDPTVPAASEALAGEDITHVARAAPSAASVASQAGSAESMFQDGGRSADASGIAVETVADGIFRTYDIRGVVGATLTPEVVYDIGRAIGSEALERGQQGLVVARDGRNSSPELAEALIRGLCESGRDVIDIGVAPTPVLYFATHYLDTASGVMVTGSHNPPEYNGLKIVLDGVALCGEAIKAIRRRIEAGDYASGSGSLQSAEMISEYIRRVSDDIPVALGSALKIVVDCGNAIPGAVAPQLLRALGHDVIELYCDVDGSFPNHHPDPSQPENLEDLIDMVKLENADLGLAFDGDGDRLGVVDGAGTIIWPDRQLMLFARDMLSRNPGAQVIYDVKCSRLLGEVIAQAGGKPIMWRTGHSVLKTKMRETGALLAGEMSGHIFFKERWYGFDDALYAAARLTEILVAAKREPAEVFAELPGWPSTPELRIALAEDQHERFMEKLAGGAEFPGATVTAIDGLRVDFEDGWGLVRPSNTTPNLIARFEGRDDAALARIQGQFRALIAAADPSLKLPF
ncbi:MAG: phosphomannomutase/phosphoglucomutase [Gammaproteobacteria bacterium]